MSSYTNFLAAFRFQCEQRGDAIALVHEQRAWSYEKLDHVSSVMALDLVNQGIQRGDRVALFCVRSIQAIAAMLAVMKSGAAFVPIDTAFPDERIRYMLDDASVTGIVADDNQSSQLDRLGVGHIKAVQWTSRYLSMEGECQGTSSTADSSADLALPNAADLAYVMYTSGSTGKPKGVVISHGSLACYCNADIDAYELTASDRTVQFSTLSFDISIEEIFPPLCIGSTVVVRPGDRSDAQIELSDIIERYSVTAVHLATGYWHEWVDLMLSTGSAVPACLRLMVVTGEKVSPEHYYRWLSLVSKPVLWANAYGPTEATVSATVFVPPAGWQGKALPIGKPLLGYTAYILDEHLQQVEAGDTGDLYIGGGALANGYLNRPELNQSVFLPDPFAPGESARMYKTGDLARWLDDGSIDYAGRVDHQIKVGSYRVEPGEIENTINSHAAVKEALVVAVPLNGSTQLVAYIACAAGSIDISDIAQFLSGQLPAYMMPHRYLLMEALPKTINGKIDRDALPSAERAERARSAPSQAARSETERQLSEIWCNILSLPDVSVDDSFISLGGDSLMAVRAIARIQKDLDFTVSTRDFFFLDTIALLAGHMEGKSVPRRVPAAVPAFINSRQRQIYTVLQRPAKDNDNGRGILLVPPVGNEQRRVQRPFRNLMQNLSRQGYTLMRFDWHGTANSSGSAVELDSLQHWVDDVHDAAEHLAGYVDRIDMVAVRLGALIASRVPTASLPVACRYYWDPVASGHAWLQEMEALHDGILKDTFRFLYRRKRTAGENREFAGLELTPSLMAEIAEENFSVNLIEHDWNQSAQLLVSVLSSLNQDDLNGCKLHRVDESNDWTDARTTTDDMVINKAASVLADLLNDAQNTTVEYPLGQSA
ncbi:MAG: amino acid adenylation domain-containing protein [Granulosicoccus sp.]